MTTQALRKLIEPPANPVDSGAASEWPKVEHDLGTTLPSDYKDYVNTFGTGQIGGFLIPFNPFSKNKYVNLKHQAKVRLDALRAIKDQFGSQECPYPLYPEPDGLLPWGATDNGDVLFWRMEGEADGWPIVINESRGPLFEEHKETMTGFLTQILNGEISSDIFPADFPGGDVRFDPVP